MSVDFRLVDYNYVVKDNVDITASSESGDFPSSNVKEFFRTKVWRTTGTFVIDSTNNKIDFDEGSGELNATLTTGTYTPTTLATEIKTQLDAVGSDIYTVSYSTVTGKWTISSDGLSLSLLWGTGSSGSPAGPSIGFTAGDETGATSYVSPSIAIHTEESLSIDIKTSEEIDSFAMVFDPVIGNKFSEDAVLTLQANPVPNWSSPAVSITLDVNNDVESITHFFTVDQSYRYWRLKIQDPKNTNLYAEVHKVILGRSIQINEVPQTGFSFSYSDQSRVEKTLYGHRYGDVFPVVRSLDFQLRLIPNADAELLWNSFQSVGNVEPIFVCIDSQEDVLNKDRMSLYGVYMGGFQFKHKFTEYFEQSVKIEEFF